MAMANAPGSTCDMLERGIASIRRSIKDKQRRRPLLVARLETLLGQPDADPEVIAETRQEIAAIDEQLPRDESDLEAFEAEFTMRCGPD